MFTPTKPIGQLVAEAKQRIENVTVDQLKAELARGGTQLLDIRDVRERQKLGWIPGSLHVPRGMLEFWLDPTSPYYSGKVDPEKRIVLYCAGGGRSVLATDVLREMGFPHVANFETGFNSWKAAGLPIEGAPADAPKEAAPGWSSR
ncbi:MAG TPA: rhodanese-like domain-containing protein [Pseudomonadales bacterium]|nr:rhodanese-like domain-containing protein [Pseudomonadales bacterium]